jgi:hypothetical protein
MTALDKLSQIIPPDIALANKALATSMQGISGINSLTLPKLATTVQQIQTNFGLPLVNAQTAPITPATANYFSSTLAKGSGPNGTITIYDMLGSAAGSKAITTAPAIMATMNLTNLQGIYQEMSTVAGQTPPIEIGGTSYPTVNDAFSQYLIPAAQAELAVIQANYPEQTAELNTSWNTMAVRLANEKTLQTAANLDFTKLVANSRTAVYGFVSSLPQYGQDTTQGGAAQYLEAVSNTTTLGGQATVGVMRQGQTNLQSSGIASTSSVPNGSTPPPAPAQLLPAQYPYPK